MTESGSSSSSPARTIIPGSIESVSTVGVVVITAPDPDASPDSSAPAKILISWDLLSRDSLDQALKSLSNAHDAALIDKLWRSAGRLARGDLPGAAPGFEEVFTRWNPAKSPQNLGPTQTTLAQGLFTCRLAGGSQAGALTAYFDWINILQYAPSDLAGVWQLNAARSHRSPSLETWIGGRLAAAQLLDPATGLCPDLPPIFVSDAATLSLARSNELNRFCPDAANPPGLVGELAAWYLVALHEQVGLPLDRPSLDRPPLNDGIALVRDIVLARIGSQSERDAARAALQGRIDHISDDSASAWIEAWCRAGIGRSLIAESDPNLRRQGVIELLHVPARFSGRTPSLAATALAHAIITLADLGDADSARRLSADLSRRFPNHPALTWEPLRAILDASRPTSSKPQPKGDGS